jgi:hypothetical protein
MMTPKFSFFSRKEQTITVASREAAWTEADRILPADYEKDLWLSKCAGHDVYRQFGNYRGRIHDFGNRLEISTGDDGENVANIWIREDAPSHAASEKTYRMMSAVMDMEFSDEYEKRTYHSLSQERNGVFAAASDFVSEWCDRMGFNWGNISIPSITRYRDGNGGGLYRMLALITEKSED